MTERMTAIWHKLTTRRQRATVTRPTLTLNDRARRLSTVASILLIGAAFVLLSYSLDRTGWLMALYERHTENTPAALLGIDAKLIGYAGALVIEVCAIALLISESIGIMQQARARTYANAGLIVVVGIPACANLLAGYLRGFWQVVALLTDKTTGAEYTAAIVIATVFWLATNAAIPALIFILSKLAAMTLAVALSVDAPPVTVTVAPIQHDSTAIAQHVLTLLDTPLSPPDATTGILAASTDTETTESLSRADKVQRLMDKYGKSARTIERMLKDGRATLQEVA